MSMSFQEVVGRKIRLDRVTNAVAILNEIGVSPNPVELQATLNLSIAADGPVGFRIYDLLGRTVGRGHLGHLTAGDHRIELPIGSIPNGVYIVRVDAGDVRLSKKFLVQR